MQFCSVSVRLSGKPNHVVSNKRVSVPEIRILQALHGADAVLDIVPLELVDTTSEEERERLKKSYEPAQVEEQRNLVDRVFGPVGALPTTLAAIGLDPRAEAKRLREKAQSLAAAADKMDEMEAGQDEGYLVEDPADDVLGFDDDVVEEEAPKKSAKKK